MVSIFLFIAVIFSGCFALAGMGKDIKDTFPICCMGVILILFILGLIVGLNIAFWVVIVISVVLYGMTLWNIVKGDRWNLVKLHFFNNILFLIVIVIIFFLWCDLGMRGGNTSDDFSHWIYIVKEMVRIDDFGTNPEANAMFASYPPGMALFQYLFGKLYMLTSADKVFSEWRCFFAYHLFMISMFFPFLKKSKRICSNILILFIFFLLPTAFYMAYYDLTIEPILAVITGTAYARILLEEKKDLMYSVYIFFSCAVLTLMKDSGLVFSVFIGVAFMADLIIMQIKKWRRSKKMLIFCFMETSVFCIVPKLLWNIRLNISHTEIRVPQTVSISTIINVIIGKDNSYRSDVFETFIKAIFSRTVCIESPWDFSETIQPSLNMSYFCTALVFFMIFYIFNKIYCSKQKLVEKSSLNSLSIEFKRRFILLVIFTVMFLTYVLGIGVAYISNFSEAEAIVLASFSRYIQLPFLSVYILLVLYFLELACIYINWTSVLSFIVFTVVVCISPKVYAWNYISRDYVKVGYERRCEYDYLSELIIDTCSEDDEVCFVDQNAWLYPYVTVRFNVRPVNIGLAGGWGSWFLTDGLLGDDNKECLFKILEENYDYLAIYRVDDFFINMYSGLFEEEITSNSLWSVNRETGKLSKVYE